MQYQKNVKIAVLCGLVLLASLLICYHVTSDRHKDKACEIAARLNVEASWDAIIHYLDQAFELGMSREDVFSILDKIGPYRQTVKDSRTWDPDLGQHVYVFEIHFADPIVQQHLRGYGFSFNEIGQLVEALRYDDRP